MEQVVQPWELSIFVTAVVRECVFCPVDTAFVGSRMQSALFHFHKVVFKHFHIFQTSNIATTCGIYPDGCGVMGVFVYLQAAIRKSATHANLTWCSSRTRSIRFCCSNFVPNHFCNQYPWYFVTKFHLNGCTCRFFHYLDIPVQHGQQNPHAESKSFAAYSRHLPF